MNKAQFRAEMRLRIAELDEDYVQISDEIILKNLIKLPFFASARRVFLYNSVKNEVKTQKIMAFCRAHSVPFALPRTLGDGRMDFCLIDDISVLKAKLPYNIYEPPESLPAIVPEDGDVVIVPGLCFDEGCFRLGHGAGYYDRFLAGCPAVSIGLCRERLVLPQVPRDEHDMPVDFLLTEIKLRNR